MASVLTQFFLIWTQDENNPQHERPSFPKRISRIRSTYFTSLLEITANLFAKQYLTNALRDIRKMTETAISEMKSGNMQMHTKALSSIKKHIYLYILTNIVLIALKDYVLRKNRNSNIFFTNKLPRFLRNLDSPSVQASDAMKKTVQGISQRSDHADLAKSYYNLTQRMLLVIVDLYYYFIILPFPILIALALATYITSFITQPFTKKQNDLTTRIRNIRSKIDMLSSLYNEAVENEGKTLINAKSSQKIYEDIAADIGNEAISEFLKNNFSKQSIHINDENRTLNDAEKTTILQGMQEAFDLLQNHVSNTLSDEEKAQGINTDFIITFMRAMITCLALYYCATTVLMSPLGFVWMITTSQQTDQAFKDSTDYVKQLTKYTKFKAGWSTTFAEVVNQQPLTLINNLEKTLPKQYFSSLWVRLGLYCTLATCLMGYLYGPGVNIIGYVISITAGITIKQSAVLAVLGLIIYRMLSGESTDYIDEISSRPLATAIIVLAVGYACLSGFQLYQLYTLATILDNLSQAVTIGGIAMVSLATFDKFALEGVAYILDTIFTTITQLGLFGIHNAACVPVNIANEAFAIPTKVSQGWSNVKSNLPDISSMLPSFSL